MRIQLHAQRIQPGLAEAVLQPLQPELAVHVALVVAVGLNSSGHNPVNQPEPQLPADHRPAEYLAGIQRSARRKSQPDPEYHHDVKTEKRQDRTCSEMSSHSHAELL